MLRGTTIRRRGEAGREAGADTITLDRQSRYRRRLAMTSDRGRPFLLDLAEATYLEAGDRIRLDDGSEVEVRSAAERLLEISAPDRHALMRIAWHIGNRHTPCEITEGALYIQEDHVLADMVRGLGGAVRAVERPFEPEGGAYGGKGPLEHGHHHHGHGHGHSHGHGDHHHDNGDDHSHGADHRPAGYARTAAPRPGIWRPDGD
jgi:urease accessory protein